MKRIVTKMITFIICVAMVIAFSVPTFATEVPVRAADKTTASAGNIMVQVPGTFKYLSTQAILDQINGYRLEACKNGYPNPALPGYKLDMLDYVPIKWSNSLEKAAQTRAAEAVVNMGHERPNGESCFTCAYDGNNSYAEVLAWNGNADIATGISQWYEEKEDWVKQNKNAVTGHYEALIDPTNKYVGIGGFKASDSDGWGAVAGEFTFVSGINEARTGISGKYRQTVEVKKSNLTTSYATKLTLVDGKSATRTLGAKTKYGDGYFSSTVNVIIPGTKYTSSNSKKVTVSSSGVIKAVGVGKATVTATANGKAHNMTVTVNPKAASIKSLTAVSKGFKVKWSKRAYSGYQIRYSTKSSMANAKTVTAKKSSTVSKKVTKLKAKKKYYVQVRTYKKVGDTQYYSKWSAKKSVRTK